MISLFFLGVNFGWKKGKWKLFNIFWHFLSIFSPFLVILIRKTWFFIFAFLHKNFLRKWFLQMGMRKCEKAKMPPCVPVTMLQNWKNVQCSIGIPCVTFSTFIPSSDKRNPLKKSRVSWFGAQWRGRLCFIQVRSV